MNNINKIKCIGLWLMLGFLGAINAAQAQIAAQQTFNLTDLKQMVFAPDGSVWGTDTYNHRVLHLTVPDSVIIGQFGVNGKNPGQLNYPQFIALAADGSIWVTDGGLVNSLFTGALTSYPVNYRLQHFKPDGTLIAYFGTGASIDNFGLLTTPPSIGQFFDIREIKLAGDETLWILDDYAGGLLQHFDANGSFIAQIKPIVANDFALAPDGSIWKTVSSSTVPVDILWQVQHFKTDGTLIASYPCYISLIFDPVTTWINTPRKIEIAPDGSFWLTYVSTLQHIKADGTLIAQLGSPQVDSQMPFGGINDITLSPDGSVWVRDTWNYFDGSNPIFPINVNRLQHFNANGALLFASPAPSAEYDNQTAILTLRNIVIADSASPTTTYQATLHYQNGQFVLVKSSVAPPSQIQAIPAVTFVPVNNEVIQSGLDIPIVTTSENSYHAYLRNLGNYVFVLDSLTPYH